MTPIKFPAKRTDGSFGIDVILRVNSRDPASLAQQMTSWMDQWVYRNRIWKTSPFGPQETLDFLSDFVCPPQCTEGPPGTLVLRFNGAPHATKRWKDWVVLRVLKELLAEFKEIVAVEKMTNSPGDVD